MDLSIVLSNSTFIASFTGCKRQAAISTTYLMVEMVVVDHLILRSELDDRWCNRSYLAYDGRLFRNLLISGQLMTIDVVTVATGFLGDRYLNDANDIGGD